MDGLAAASKSMLPALAWADRLCSDERGSGSASRTRRPKMRPASSSPSSPDSSTAHAAVAAAASATSAARASNSSASNTSEISSSSSSSMTGSSAPPSTLIESVTSISTMSSTASSTQLKSRELTKLRAAMPDSSAAGAALQGPVGRERPAWGRLVIGPAEGRCTPWLDRCARPRPHGRRIWAVHAGAGAPKTSVPVTAPIDDWAPGLAMFKTAASGLRGDKGKAGPEAFEPRRSP
mmetsp:Transcript_723/g.2317  ORF Transcript_723/g.2317 Transcript_723/m.2317 type:complete len:236 (-) Transcript_723:8-715(-)